MVIKMLKDGDSIENAPSAVRSLILFNELDFDELRPICLEQETLLLSDKIYQMSDSDTRARYRKVISELSRKSGKSEKEVTEIASLNGSITESLFNEENQKIIKSAVPNPPKVQLVIGDGLSSAAITDSAIFFKNALSLLPRRLE